MKIGGNPTRGAKAASSGWVIHSFLAAIFPVVSLLSSNAPDVPLSDTVIPLVGMLSLSVLLWFGSFFLLRDRMKSGLFVLGILVLFWSYGAVLDGIRAVFQYRETLSGLQILPLVALELAMLFTLLVMLRRMERSLGGLTRFLNLASGISVALAVGISANEYGRMAAASAFSLDEVLVTVSDGKARDIVYIIADAYGRHDVIRDLYDYDNIVFVEELEARGFYVAHAAHSNYNRTRFSVPATLNLDYVDGVADELGGDKSTTELIQNSLLFSRLKQRGYKIFGFATGYSETELHGADQYFKPRVLITEYQQILVDKTPIRSLMNRVRSHLATRNGPRTDAHDLHRGRVLFTLDTLQQMTWTDEPEFVFAHILSPHYPYVLDENSGPVYPEIRYNLAVDYKDWERPTWTEFTDGYRKQVQGVNRLFLETIDAVRRNNPDAIIILQGDHGPRRRAILSDPDPWQTYAREELAILNAFYLPDIEVNKILYPKISSVNTFRVILNGYFQEDFPMLEDRGYLWSDTEKRLQSVAPDLLDVAPPRVTSVN